MRNKSAAFLNCPSISQYLYSLIVVFLGKYQKCHARRSGLMSFHVGVILCKNFTRPSTALAVIEGLGMRLNVKPTRLVQC